MEGNTITVTGPDAVVLNFEFIPTPPAVVPAANGAPAAFVVQEEGEKEEEKEGEKEGEEGETALERRERTVAAARAARSTIAGYVLAHGQAIFGTPEWDGNFVDGHGPESTPEEIAELLAVAAATSATLEAWGVAETERRREEDEETERMKK
ncbi:hypothetical protein VTL71DRAFT_3125 [Oculimacula yallundae]|uniref:DUF4376 domain-containing protein n=1 Tax=Oculimacula yallundae TaxID=86028 RepID=A0ABR4C6Y6_9HELO